MSKSRSTIRSDGRANSHTGNPLASKRLVGAGTLLRGFRRDVTQASF